MQIVIDIPDKTYEYFAQGLRYADDVESAIIAIVDGTQLLKGHGRLGDLDAVMDDINRSIEEMTNIGIMVDGEWLWGKLNDAIYNTPTIIEADKENEE